MAWHSKVVWSEGMFLRPQHFQQFERYVEHLVRGRSDGLVPHAWGLSELALNRGLLESGQFGLTSAAGVMADGTPFRLPDDVAPPTPLRAPEGTRGAIVHLCLPLRQPGHAEVNLDGRRTITRYRPDDHEALDTNTGAEEAAAIRIGRMNLTLGLEGQDLSGYTTLGLARIAELRADRAIVLDEDYVPPCLHCSAHAALTGFVDELNGLLNARGEGLAGRAAESGQGVSEVADFLLLQAVNRYIPVFEHYARLRELHPERLYTTCAAMAGEFATFFAPDRKAPALPSYRHDDLENTLGGVMGVLRQLFKAEFTRPAVPIPLHERKYGIRVGMPEDRSLLDEASFVLAVKAEMPAEKLRAHFPRQCKIGPVEEIRDLVNSALPGIAVRPLPVAPRQIPFHRGTTYFELDSSSEYWRRMRRSGAFAVFIAGEFPGVEVELWAIRE
ncbi:MAG: type VI secretion system baseplate subunit TssK [Alphaproteobacteria bacterium]|jgi:type VI secretion system protein ImpJ|nr:type VI secretion system baseplate subunit TssK [Alphaproteobacteria bacterium]